MPGLARACLLVVLVGFSGCAEKHARPVPHIRLVDVVADEEGDGVLVYVLESMSEGDNVHVVRQKVGGGVVWHRSGEVGRAPKGTPTVLPGAVVLELTGPKLTGGTLLHVRLADGAMRELTPTIARAAEVRVVGDAAAMFAVWRAAGEMVDRPVALGIAGFDAKSGERVWAVEEQVSDEDVLVRLDDRYLLIGSHGSDWSAYARADGRRVELPVIDPPGLCRAHGSWWGGRDDALVRLSLDGEVPAQRSARATFVPEEFQHQWSLVDCAAHGDEVVVTVNLEPYRTGRIAGVDPETMATRWVMDLPYSFSPVIEPRSGHALPAELGDTLMVAQLEDWSRSVCAVDLAGHRQRWCAQWPSGQFFADGDDWVVTLGPVGVARDLMLARVRGSDGEVVAAAAMRDPVVMEWERTHEHARAGHVWMHGVDEDPSRQDELPLVVLGAATLRPVAAEAFGRARAASSVRDASGELKNVLVMTDALPPARGQGPYTARTPGDPWEVAIVGRRPEAAPASTTDVRHGEVLAAGLTEAGLPVDTPVRVLGRRGRYVIGWAEHSAADGPRWTLIHGYGDQDRHQVGARTLRRRPTEFDVYAFLEEVDGGRGPDEGAGTTDEEAWFELTGVRARTQVWLVR